MVSTTPLYNKEAVSSRLKELISSNLKKYNTEHADEPKLNQKDYITNVLGLNSERVRSYTKGNRSNIIPLDVACDLCSKFGCSIDYLLGADDIHPGNDFISQQTGLSNKAIERLITAKAQNEMADRYAERINELYDKIDSMEDLDLTDDVVDAADQDDDMEEDDISAMYDEISELEDQMPEADVLPSIIDQIINMPSFPYLVHEYLYSFETSIISIGKRNNFQRATEKLISSGKLNVNTDADRSSVCITGFGKEFYVNNNITIDSDIIRQAIIKKMQGDLDNELKSRSSSLASMFDTESDAGDPDIII